jgi:ribosomal protein S12 methylthiotransferase accessory factor
MMKRASPLQKLYDMVDRLVDDQVGVVSYVKELPREAGGPGFFHFYAQSCSTDSFSAQRNFSITGGASTERGTAMAKAIGEAVERYCSAIYDVNDFSLESFESAPFHCVHPAQFALYSRSQYEQQGFPYVPFDQTTLVRWVPARDLQSGEAWYVPAAMVFVPYHYDTSLAEPPIVQPISTGLACHCTYEEAALSAICEVIERDAFTITWQARLGRPHIEIASLSDTNFDRVSRFERTGGSVTLLNLTMDHGIPTILSVRRYRALDAPALVFAAAAHPDPEEAVRKSLEELAHTRRFAQLMKSDQPAVVTDPHFAKVIDQDSHVNLYTDHLNVGLADFIFASDVRIGFEEIASLDTGDVRDNLKIVGAKIQSVGHQILLADITSEDIRTLGLSVVRAIIPGFHPLFIGHRVRALGGSRLWDIPPKLGYKSISTESGDNPAPHPYP